MGGGGGGLKTNPKKPKRHQMVLARNGTRKRNLMAVAVAAFVVSAYIFNNMRSRHYLRRSGLLSPRLSPWRKLLWHGDDMAFLELTGLDRSCFNSLRDDIHRVERRVPRNGRGRPPSLDCQDRVGLCLMYVTSHMRTKHLCCIFGVVPTVCNNAINDTIVKMFVLLKIIR